MSLPAVNRSDPVIPRLQTLTTKIYKPCFDSLIPSLSSIVKSLHENAQLHSSSDLVKDDLAWVQESLSKDSSQLMKIHQHVKFLNAEETITTRLEIIKVFSELMDFLNVIVMDDLIAKLKGLASTISSNEEDCLKVGQNGLGAIVSELLRAQESLNFAVGPLKSLFDGHDVVDGLTLKEFNNIETAVDDRIDDFEKSLKDLESLCNV